jgi:PAT family beta-lactamase induction signal transducer AmpG
VIQRGHADGVPARPAPARPAPTLSDSRALRLTTFGALNAAQGLPWGFIVTGYFYMLADLKLPPEQIGAAIAWARFPWAFKMVWGLVYDRFPGSRWGRRRPFILASQALMGLAMLALACVPDPARQLWLVSALLFLVSLFTTMQNVATNGLGVDIIDSRERGRANAIMWAAKSVGTAVGGGACYALSPLLGWPALMVGMAMMIWAIALLPLLVRERPPGAPAPGAGRRLDLRELARTFTFPTPYLGLLAALVVPLGYGLMSTPLSYLLRNGLELSETRIGLLNGPLDACMGVAGSLAGGFLTDRFGARRIMTVGALGMIAGMMCLASTAGWWPSFAFIAGWSLTYGFFQYLFGAAMLSFFMSLSNPVVGATHLGLYFAMNNLCFTLADRWGGMLLTRFGYVDTFLICAAIQALALIPLACCDPRKAELRYRPAPSSPAS